MDEIDCDSDPIHNLLCEAIGLGWGKDWGNVFASRSQFLTGFHSNSYLVQG